MTVDIWVENHQPVSLAPLVDLKARKGTLLYIGRRVAGDGAVFEGGDAPGWVVFDGQDGFGPVADPGSVWYDDTLDWGRSLGRILQPGEALHVRYRS
jgi:hypothetical protein